MSDERFLILLATLVVVAGLLAFGLKRQHDTANHVKMQAVAIARVAHAECDDVNLLKAVTKRTLKVAMDRTTDVFLAEEIGREIIALDGPRDCTP